MNHKFISIDITPNSDSMFTANGGVMWEHNATSLKFTIAPELVGDYRYYIEYRSLMGTKVRTEYLELNIEDNTVTYHIPVSMSSLKGVECYFNVVSIDEDGNTVQIIKPKKFCLTFDYSPDTDNSLCKVNDFSINSLLEAIRLGTFKGDKGEKGDTGEKGEKGDTGGISEDYATKNFANAIKGKMSGTGVMLDDVSPVEHGMMVSLAQKNLVDISKFMLNQTVSGAGAGGSCVHLAATGYAALWDLRVLPNTTYTFSLDNSVYWLDRMCEMNSDDLCTKNHAFYVNTNNDYSEYTFTTQPNTEYLIVRLRNKSNASVTADDLSEVNLQIELGKTATQYTPYIDPTTMTLTTCGKNFFDGKLVNGYYLNADFDVTDASSLVFQSFRRFYPKGTYTVSFDEKVNIVCMAWLDNFNQDTITDVTSFTFIVEKDCYYGFSFRKTDNSEWDKSSPIQIERGNVVTTFEEYRGADYTPEKDGRVSDVKSIAPNMNVLSDVDGATITAYYNKDINKVIEKIITAVKALGGTI